MDKLKKVNLPNDSKMFSSSKHGSKKKDYQNTDDIMNNSLPQEDQKRIPTCEDDPLGKQHINIEMCD